jgi:alcohol dehydrogenase
VGVVSGSYFLNFFSFPSLFPLLLLYGGSSENSVLIKSNAKRVDEDEDLRFVRACASVSHQSSKEMRAAQYSGFGGEVSVKGDVPYPLCPPDGVIVRMRATGVCRSDWHGWMGHDGDIHSWFKKNEGRAFTPGHELAGEIVESGTSKFNVGDRVAIPFILSCGCCNSCNRGRATVCLHQEQPGFTFPGSYAEFVAIPRANRNLTVLPNNVSYLEAAALGCRFTTAFRALIQQGKLTAGQRVAVIGSGGLGLASIMVARAAGAGEVWAIDVRREALDKAQEVEPATESALLTTDGHNTLYEESRPGQCIEFDLTIECSGFASGCEVAVRILRPGGRMVQVGLCLGKEQPVVPMGLVTAQEIEIVGSHGFDGANDMKAILAMVERGVLQPAKLVNQFVSLEGGAQTLMDMSKKSPTGFIMIVPSPDLADLLLVHKPLLTRASSTHKFLQECGGNLLSETQFNAWLAQCALWTGLFRMFLRMLTVVVKSESEPGSTLISLLQKRLEFVDKQVNTTFISWGEQRQIRMPAQASPATRAFEELFKNISSSPSEIQIFAYYIIEATHYRAWCTVLEQCGTTGKFFEFASVWTSAEQYVGTNVKGPVASDTAEQFLETLRSITSKRMELCSPERTTEFLTCLEGVLQVQIGFWEIAYT